jgi:hypothetical protein
MWLLRQHAAERRSSRADGRAVRAERNDEMNTIEQLSSLKVAHQTLEGELQTLRRRAHLTPIEEQRARIIKKQKLRTKDCIRVLMGEMRRSY